MRGLGTHDRGFDLGLPRSKGRASTACETNTVVFDRAALPRQIVSLIGKWRGFLIAMWRGLTEVERSAAMRRFEEIRHHGLHGVSPAGVARNDGLPLRSPQRWSARYRAAGIPRLGNFPRPTASK